MHTEEEAGKMFCPMNSGTRSCIASKCPMWRWGKRKEGEGYAKQRGYCGLAGRVVA